MKTCTKCGEEKALDAFYLRSPEGLRHAQCKECLRERARNHYAANKADLRANRKPRSERSKEREKERRSTAEWREHHRQRVAKYRKTPAGKAVVEKYREKSRDKSRQASRRYYERIAEHLRQKNRQEIRDLSDTYIVRVLKARNPGCSVLPEGVIAAKRLQLAIRRLAKEQLK